jgi:hypothetical protein
LENHLNFLQAWISDPQKSLLMPTFSLDPSKCITQIGEHLRTLPYHMEPFMDNDISISFDPKGLVNLNNILESSKELHVEVSDLEKLDTSVESVIPTETETHLSEKLPEEEGEEENK